MNELAYEKYDSFSLNFIYKDNEECNLLDEIFA